MTKRSCASKGSTSRPTTQRSSSGLSPRPGSWPGRPRSSPASGTAVGAALPGGRRGRGDGSDRSAVNADGRRAADGGAGDAALGGVVALAAPAIAEGAAAGAQDAEESQE